MFARRFHGKNENLSFNLTGGERTMVVEHPTLHSAQISQDQRAHNSYRAMCERIGVPVLIHEEWMRIADKFDGRYSKAGTDGALAQSQNRFQGGTYDGSAMAGAYEPARREWSGAWDNAVRALEG